MSRKTLVLLVVTCLALGCPSSPKKSGGDQGQKDIDKKDDSHINILADNLNLRIEERASQWEGQGNSAFGRPYAILVGADKYQHNQSWNVPFVANNVQKLKRVLVDHLKFPEENIKVLTGDKVTPDAVKSAIENGFSQKIRGKDNLVVFYYAGHGFVGEKDRRQHFLTSLSTNSRENQFSHTFRDSDLQKAFHNLQKNLRDKSTTFRSLAILDACQNSALATLSPQMFTPKEIKISQVVLTSTRPGQRAVVSAKAQMSLFTEHLCQVLTSQAKGDRVQINSVYNTLQNKMTRASHQPQLKGDGEDLELFTRQAIPVTFEVRDALQPDRELKGAKLKLNDQHYECPASIPNLEQNKYFLELSYPGYFFRAEEVSITPSQKGQKYVVYLTPAFVIIKGRVVNENERSTVMGMEVAALGKFQRRVVDKYHMAKTRLTTSGGRFTLYVPPFDRLPTLAISQSGKILAKKSPGGYSLQKHKGIPIKVYDMGEITINAKLPSLDTMLSAVQTTAVSQSNSKLFALDPSLLQENRQIKFQSDWLKQRYTIILRKLNQRDYDFALRYIKYYLKQKVQVDFFRRLQVETYLRVAQSYHHKGDQAKSLAWLRAALRLPQKARDKRRCLQSLERVHWHEGEQLLKHNRFDQAMTMMAQSLEYTSVQDREDAKQKIYRLYLQEIKNQYGGHNYSRALERLDQGRKYTNANDARQLEHALCTAWLEHCVGQMVNHGLDRDVDSALFQSRRRFPKDPKIYELREELKKERIPLESRKAYIAGGNALNEAKLEEAENHYLQAWQGANHFYRPKIEKQLDFIQGKLALKCEAMAVVAEEKKNYQKAYINFLRSYHYRPDELTLENIRTEIFPKISAQDQRHLTHVQLYRKAKQTDVNLQTDDDYKRAIAAYKASLAAYPQGILADRIQLRLKTLDKIMKERNTNPFEKTHLGRKGKDGKPVNPFEKR